MEMDNHPVYVKCAIEAVAGHSCQLAAAAAGGVAHDLNPIVKQKNLYHLKYSVVDIPGGGNSLRVLCGPK